MADVYLSATIRPSVDVAAHVGRMVGFSATIRAKLPTMTAFQSKAKKAPQIRPGDRFEKDGVTIIVIDSKEEVSDGKALRARE